MFIPFNDLEYQNSFISESLKEFLSNLNKTNQFLLGPELINFEENLSSFFECGYAVGVANGTDALEIALRSMDLPPGSEIIIPVNSFIASAIAVNRAGFRIRFCDVDYSTHLINAEFASNYFSKETSAVMAVHLFGQCVNMTELSEFANKNNLKIIEDAAQAQGAKHKDKNIGSWGIVAATSFYPGKNLGAWGDAGAVLTNSKEINDTARLVRNYGSKVKYRHEQFGFNSRMDEIQAFVLNEKLKQLQDWNKERNRIADRYNLNLKSVTKIQIPVKSNFNYHVYHLYVIKTNDRDDLQKFLRDNGIETSIHYPNVLSTHKFLQMSNSKFEDYPNAIKLSKQMLSLPIYPGLELNKVDFICEKIDDWASKYGR